MMTRIVFFIVIAFSCVSYGIVNSQSGLSALLQQESQPSSTNLTTATTALSENPKLSTLFSTSMVSSSPVVAPADLQAKLLQQFVSEQSSPLYIKAMSILNDSSLKVIYNNALLSIQLFFMQYATDDLNKLLLQSSAENKPSLSSLLSTIALSSAASSTDSGVIGLSLLLNNSQAVNRLNVKTQVQNSVNNLLQQLSVQSNLAPAVQQSNVGLQNLLDAVATPLVHDPAIGLQLQTEATTTVVAKKTTDSLSMLFAPQG